MIFLNLSRILISATFTGLCCASAFAAPALSSQADLGWIRVQDDGQEGKAALFRPDGTGRKETARNALNGKLSPDGKSILYVRSAGNDSIILLADASGKNEKRVSPDKLQAGSPCWSPDGKRIAFLGKCGDFDQVHVMDRDGANVRQHTKALLGATSPRFAPDGRLSYLTVNRFRGKLYPTSLVISNGKEEKSLLKDLILSDHAWSPDGKTIAYGRLGALVYHDLASGKEQTVAFAELDARADGHMASGITWSPDGKAIACTIQFCGDRPARAPGNIAKMFGDDQVFVIPRTGKPTWFEPGFKIGHLEWVRGK